MSHANGIISKTGDLPMSEIADVLGVPYRTDGTLPISLIGLCTSNKINKWAKHKPVNGAYNNGAGDGTFGLNVPVSINSMGQADVIANWNNYWAYTKRPTYEYRESDFRGYDHKAVVPIKIMWNTGSTYHQGIVYKWGYYSTFSAAIFGNQDGNIGVINGVDHRPYMLKLSDFTSFHTSFGSWKFALLNYHYNGNISEVTSDTTVSQFEQNASVNLPSTIQTTADFFMAGTQNMIYPVLKNYTQYIPLPADPLQVTVKEAKEAFDCSIAATCVRESQLTFRFNANWSIHSKESYMSLSWDSQNTSGSVSQAYVEFTLIYVSGSRKQYLSSGIVYGNGTEQGSISDVYWTLDSLPSDPISMAWAYLYFTGLSSGPVATCIMNL